MFKKKKVALSVALGVLGVAGVMTSAQAVHVNPEGTGQVLVFPYFNAQSGYVTNINLVNSTDQTKAVRIRFNEGKTSKDVLDFNIYMSPEDVWTGSIKATTDANGKTVGSMTTMDCSCTLPEMVSCKTGVPEVTVPFSGYDMYTNVDPEDTLEGYVEVVEMGVVSDTNVQSGVLHVNGQPNNCGVIADAWYRKWFTTGQGSSAKGLSAPTGGLMGSSAVLNVGEGVAMAVDPVALDNYTTLPYHTRPDDPDHFDLPSLASGSVHDSEVMIKKSDGSSEMVVTTWDDLPADPCLNDGDPVTPACGTNPYPVAHALLTSQVMNEYFLDPSLGYDGHTDWVVTFPMKKLGIFQGKISQLTKEPILNENGKPTGKYLCVDEYGYKYSTDEIGNADCKLYGDVQVAFGEEIFDREEGRIKDANFSPYPSKPPRILEREVNVLTFTSTDPAYDASRTVLSSNHKLPSGKARADADGNDVDDFVDVGSFVSGWSRMSFHDRYRLSGGFLSAEAYGESPEEYTDASSLYQGVPAIGFAAVEGNVSANPNARFGDALPHKTKRK